MSVALDNPYYKQKIETYPVLSTCNKLVRHRANITK
jgi:hypothetical protein